MIARIRLAGVAFFSMACGEEARLFEADVFQVAEPAAEVPCDDVSWQSVPAPTEHGLSGVWGVGDDDLWAVGGRGSILRYDGAVWRDVSPGTVQADLMAVHGSSRDDVWVVGRAGYAARWDGARWSAIDTGTDQILVGVWAHARNDVWMVGVEGVRRWNGTAVVAEASWPREPINALWSPGPADLHMVSDTATHHYDGEAFTTVPIGNAGRLAAIWGVDRETAWTIGHGAFGEPGFARLEGGHWIFSAAPRRSFFFSIWTDTHEELWAGADLTTVFYLRPDSVWCREHLGGVGAVTGFFGASARMIWAVGAKDEGGETRPVLLRRMR